MAVERISCVLIGEGPLLVQCGDLLLSRRHRIKAVVSSSTAVRQWAEQQGIAFLERGEETDRKLESVSTPRFLPKSPGLRC